MRDAARRRVREIKEVQKVTDEERYELQKIILENNPTEFILADIKNVLVCGASRGGKSTLFFTLQNPCYCPQKTSIFSDTKFTNFKTFTLRDKSDGTVHSMVVSMVDTPGTFEVRLAKDDFEKRSNEQINELIVDCINNNVTYLNLLILVVNSQRISDTEIESIDIFIKLLGESKIPIILCLTHADKIGASRRKEIEEEIKIHPRLISYCEKEIFQIRWMGCVNYLTQDYTSKQVMENDYNMVAEWRDILIEDIFKAEKKIRLSDTDIYQSRKEMCNRLLQQVQIDMNTLINIDIDNPSSDDELKLINHTKNMDFLYLHSKYIDDVRTGAEGDLYHTFHVFIDGIAKSGKNPKLIGRLLGKWLK